MCKVFFIEGPDYSGKTTLIKNLSNYFKSNGRRVAIFREPDGEFRKMLLDKDSNLSFATRRALFAADHLQTLDTIYQSRDKYDYIFVDEVQFLSKEQIKQLWRIAHKQNIDVFCYGLKNTYQNNLFPGAEQLLIMADTSEEIKSKCCYCGNKATTHLRFVNGKVETEGDLIKVDNNESRNNNEEYKSVCQDCWYERK